MLTDLILIFGQINSVGKVGSETGSNSGGKESNFASEDTVRRGMPVCFFWRGGSATGLKLSLLLREAANAFFLLCTLRPTFLFLPRIIFGYAAFKFQPSNRLTIRISIISID